MELDCPRVSKLRNGSFPEGVFCSKFCDLDVQLVSDQASSSVLTPLSPASSHSLDSTIVLESTRKSRNPTGLMEQNEARQKVDCVLRANPKGEEIFKEYEKTKTLTCLQPGRSPSVYVWHMLELHGMIPWSSVKTNYALGIVTLFPYLQDPFSKHGYEHYYDPLG
ncbi:uncharacterized protein LOC128630390 isoform X2 [Ictalurus punctatus]|uniref:Uncharacterized protein LOC128630390 isoform X2 n=1 Tax=Ictalurus punctatus TaxID=7998 RepID=A0A9F7REA1_ICTPU|nr:uncharacterized protein LOC128630390 isoform X2 [Ictalurus punctatus]